MLSREQRKIIGMKAQITALKRRVRYLERLTTQVKGIPQINKKPVPTPISRVASRADYARQLFREQNNVRITSRLIQEQTRPHGGPNEPYFVTTWPSIWGNISPNPTT